MKIDKGWLKQLKPGDEVIFCYNDYKGSEAVAKVEKITPKGYIKVRGISFTPTTGRPHGDYRCMIYKPTEEIKKRIYETAVIKKARLLLSALKNADMTYERAVEIIKIFSDTEAAKTVGVSANNQIKREAT